MAGEMIYSAASLPYHAPDIVVILTLASFLLLLNIANAALDRLLYCGLLGQVLIGIAWGTSGAQWLTIGTEETIVQLGYIGLVLLVYEGGLHTSFPALQANLFLSCGVALTGIAAPIGLSFTLQVLLHATPVQAFAAGAALASTSLGTTFTIVASSGLAASRLGVVLTSAAMMDDVVGLVMVQVISNLGDNHFDWTTVVRPVLVSVAFAVVVPLGCLYVARPVTLWLNAHRKARPAARLNTLLVKPQTAFFLHTLLLIGSIVGATYAGTSNLFAAYMAGAAISWWDTELPHPSSSSEEKKGYSTSQVPGMSPESQGREPITGERAVLSSHASNDQASDPAAEKSGPGDTCTLPPNTFETCGTAIYQRCYQSVVSKVLQPLFFASIGFAIPITRMFHGSIVWRGIVYTVLMALAKLVCGVWLVRAGTEGMDKSLSNGKLAWLLSLWRRSQRKGGRVMADCQSPEMAAKRGSLQPALVLGLAMCARGEIGFLLSGVAESAGVFSGSGVAGAEEPSDEFLVVTWAIVLCTLVGPLGVGFWLRRMKRVEEGRGKQAGRAGREMLGVWGVP